MEMEDVGFDRDLLEYYIKQDNKIVLHDPENSFEITLSLAAAKRFSPVLKTTLETNINKAITPSGSDEMKYAESYRLQRIEVKEFERSTVDNFVQYLHGYGDELNLEWEDMIELLKMSHFYNVEKLFKVCQDIGRTLLIIDNLYEAISLMEKYEFTSWCDLCSKLLMDGNSEQFNTQEWKSALQEQPKTMAVLQNIFIEAFMSKIIDGKHCIKTHGCLCRCAHFPRHKNPLTMFK